MVTEVPVEPLAGVNPVTVGAGTTKLLLEQPCAPPLTLTQIAPADIPFATATNWLDVADVTLAQPLPLKDTQSFAAVEEKPVPVIVTDVPGRRLLGLNPVTVAGTAKLFVE